MIWTGLSFTVLGHRDGRFLHLPGLFAFARRDSEHGALLLFVGEAEDLGCEAGAAHPQWEEALHLGMDELHVHFPVRAGSTGFSSWRVWCATLSPC